MIEENIARLRAHRNNIQRSRQLLETRLTDLERRFIEKRLSEEQLALETLAASTLPTEEQRLPYLGVHADQDERR